MSYRVLSRKWRPKIFEEIIGQSHITNTLKNAISLKRVAHGYLFFGPRGVGKTTCARILSKALNCLNLQDSNPCNSCNNCQQILDGSSLDVLEIDGASNRGIDEIRELREAVKYPPSSGSYRIYIIDEVHMLTQQAFNALLKTLEEPPSHVKFIMATTEVNKVPQTILSRTMRFNFHRINSSLIMEHLSYILNQEKVDYDNDAIKLIAKKADGSLRDSLSFLDQIISYSDSKIELTIVKQVLGIIEESVYLDLLSNCYSKKQSEVLSICNNIFESGTPILDCLKGWNEFIRNIILLKSDQKDMVSLSDKTQKYILENYKDYAYIDFLRILNLSLKLESELNRIDQIEIAFETLMLKICIMDSTVHITDLINQNNSNKLDLKPVKKINNSKIVKTLDNIKENDKIKSKDDNSSNVKIESNQEVNNIFDLSYFKENWVDIKNQVEKIDSKLNVFLEDSKPEKFINNELRVVLPDGNVFQANNLQKNKQIFEKAILDRTKTNVKVLFFSKELEKNNTKDNPLTKDHPLMNDAIEMFNGEIIK